MQKEIIKNTALNFTVFNGDADDNKPAVMLLHGFSGSSADWSEVIPRLDEGYKYIAADLPGHGSSPSPANIYLYSPDSTAEMIKSCITKSRAGKIILLGYSMGGRAALSFAVKYPNLLRALILESSSPGIEDEAEKHQRIKKDEKLASFIETSSLEEFSDYWMNIGLFDSQKSLHPEKLNQIRESKLKNNRRGLANSLRGFGTGTMPYLLNALPVIKVPVQLITGELDAKFTGIGSIMKIRFPGAAHTVIPGAGHNTHLENPEAFIQTVNSFLSGLQTESSR